MAEFVKVARREEVAEGTGRCVEIGERRIGLFNLDGEIYAIDDTCTHAQASLCEGVVSGDEVACPLHGATFAIRTGEVTGPPADEDVRTYPVRIENDEVWVEVG